MWLVLCERGDVSALWAYRGLAARGLAPVELVTSESLACALRWQHRLDGDGVQTEVVLADGRALSSDEVKGTVNRLQTVPTNSLSMASAPDRDYALQEITALVMSWLRSLPGPMLNRPSPTGLSGPWHHIAEWTALAARAGLPTAPYAHTSHDPEERRNPTVGATSDNGSLRSLIVVAGGVVGPSVDTELVVGARRMAELAGTGLLGVHFATDEDGDLVFADATPLPDLSTGQGFVLDLLVAALTR